MTDPAHRWERVGSRILGEFASFRVRRDSLRTPDGEDLTYDLLDMADWVQVIALTPAEEVVLVEQYRPGTDRVVLEFPGGFVDTGEDVRAAALRELEEETAYCADGCHLAAALEPNAALQSNHLWVAAVEGCLPDGTEARESGEDIRVRLATIAEVERLIAEGTIRDVMSISSWDAWRRWRDTGLAVGVEEMEPRGRAPEEQPRPPRSADGAKPG